MQGLITINNHRYLFKDDHGYGPGIWAWCIDDEVGVKVKTHKWNKLPERADSLVLFNLDNPPRTVSYQPLLGD